MSTVSFAATTDGNGKRFVYGPAESIDPQVQNIGRYARLFSPLWKGKRLAIEGEVADISLISILLCPCLPTAVLGRIAKFIVYSTKRILWPWCMTHVGEEVVKRVQPTFAYGDATRGIVLLTRSTASVLHGGPCQVLLRLNHALVVDSISVSFLLHQAALSASATQRLTAAQVVLKNSLRGSALASAKPHSTPVVLLGWSNDNPRAKGLSCQVGNWFHVHLQSGHYFSTFDMAQRHLAYAISIGA